MNKAIKDGLVRYNDELCLSKDYIIENTDISYNYLRVATSRFNNGSSKSWKNFKSKGIRYFVYESLPRSSKGKLLPKGELLAKTYALDDNIISLILKSKLFSYKLFKKNNSFEHAFALAILHEVSIYIAENKILYSKGAFFQMLSDEIEIQQIRYLPKTWRNLRDKIKEYHDSINMQI